jgi:TolA-binding protein
MRLQISLSVIVMALASGCGVFASQKDHDNLVLRNAALEKSAQSTQAAYEALRADLEATRGRLDNALRANADANAETLGDKAKLGALSGRMDELARGLDDLKRDFAASRSEIDGRLDELKRGQDAQSTKAPPLNIPADKGAHVAAVRSAYEKKDWATTRALGREFVTRYASDEEADDVLYLIGDAALREGRPAAALGEFNRVLKQFPKSNVLGQTLYGMGDAYLALKDCANAKLAYSTCESRFPKDRIGMDARGKLQLIAKPSSGMCTP